MVKNRNTCFFAAIALSVAALTSPGAATEFRAQNGEVLPAPALAGLSCEHLDALMLAYSQSFYRDLSDVPKDHPDRPIFEYEDRLAEQYFTQCQRGRITFQDTAPAFSKGFR